MALNTILPPARANPNVPLRWRGARVQMGEPRGALASTTGTAVEDVFTDIGKLEASAKEKVGYPTQKPLALLERIIAASSNESDVVLDPFCGCATALVAAEKLQRQWVGIDLSAKAKDLIKDRMGKELGLFGLQTVYRTDVPQRTDMGKLPPYRTHKNDLYGRQEGHCAGCKVLFDIRNFTIDHIVPQRDGGTHHLDNLQALRGVQQHEGHQDAGRVLGAAQTGRDRAMTGAQTGTEIAPPTPEMPTATPTPVGDVEDVSGRQSTSRPRQEPHPRILTGLAE